MNIIKPIIVSIGLFFAISANGQSYNIFNDSAQNGWNVRILNYTEGKNMNRLLLSYQNPNENTLYPAIGIFENGSIKITQLMSEPVINIFPFVLKPDNGLALPTTTIQNQKYWYDLKELDEKGKSANLINVAIYPYQILAGGIYPLFNKTYLELTTIQKEPDNGGQSAFYNVWFKLIAFDEEKSYKKEIHSDQRIKSVFNEEAISGCKGNDTLIYILARRFTKKDFSEFEGVLYAVGYSGRVLWSDKIPWNKDNTLSIFSYNNGVVLCDANGYDKFLFPNSTFLTFYDVNGKTTKGAILDKFVAACGLETSDKNLILGGSVYKVDSIGKVVVKKAKTVLLGKDFAIKQEDVLDFYEGPDGELTMMQYATSNEILSITEKKDKTFILTGSVYKPYELTPFSARVHYGMLLYADPSGKISR